MIMRNLFRAAIIGMITLSIGHASEQIDPENLKALMVTELKSELATDLGRHLQDSGMAESDALRTIDQLAEEMSECTINAVARLAEEQMFDPDSVLARLQVSLLENNGKDFDAGLDEERLKERLNYCFVIAFGNAGIEAPQIVP